MSSTPTARPWSSWKVIKPLGADAHQFYDDDDPQARAGQKHVEHVQDFWGDTLTAAGSQSTDGKAAYVQVYLAGNQGSALANEARRRRPRHRRPHETAAGCQGLCHRPGAADLGSVRRGQQGHRKGHRDHHRDDRVDVVFRLPLCPHDAARALHGPHRNVRRPGNCRVSRERRGNRAVDLRDESADAVGYRRRNGLRDIFRRAATKKRAAPARIGKRPSTPCFAGPPISCWVPA